MTAFKYILPIGIILLSLSSCKEKPQLTGHWVSKGYFQNKPFRTIDFSAEKDVDFETGKEKDSIVYYVRINKNSLSHEISALLFDDSLPNRYSFLLMHDDFYSLDFKNDSLYMMSQYKFWDGVFVKVNEPFVSQQELFLGSELEIELPECDGTYIPTDPKRAINFNISYKHDSIYVNQYDLYISDQEIEDRIRQAKESLLSKWSDQTSQVQPDNVELHLNCDRGVPDSFVRQIITHAKAVDPTLKIYKASFDSKNKKLCYKPIL